MKIYSIKSEPSKDSALLEDYQSAREIGAVRIGKDSLFFRVRLRVYYIPYRDIRRCFRRVFVLPANVCCGKGDLEVENLVVWGDAGELAQIQLPGTRAAKEVIRTLKERIPEADFTSPNTKPESRQS